MVQPASPESPGLPKQEERRRYQRVAFPPLRRPVLKLPYSNHPLLDASLSGIRILHTGAVKPAVGSVVDCHLEWLYGEPPLRFRGTVVWVSKDAVGIKAAPGTIPLGYLPGTV